MTGAFPRLLALAAVTGLATAVAAAALDVALEPYQQTARAGAVGTVAGRAIEDPQRPGDPPGPASDVAVTLLPRSESLLAAFADVKRRARRTEKEYRASAPALVEARRELERALAAAGAAELVRYVVAGPDGQFEVGQVPAGDWVVIAERRRFVSKGGTAVNKRESEIFAPMPRMVGYWTVTVWLKEIAVTAGSTETLELTDRNAWMTAIEERRPGTDR